MENIGKEPGTVHGSLHGPSTIGQTSDATAPSAAAGQKFADDFHLYAAEWEPGAIRFYVDSTLCATFNSSQWPAGGTWVSITPSSLSSTSPLAALGPALRTTPPFATADARRLPPRLY